MQQSPPSWTAKVTVLGNQAASLMMLGKLPEAVDVCNEALEIDPQAAKLFCRRGRALIRLGMLTTAAESFRSALKITSVQRDGQLNYVNLKTSIEASKNLEIIGILDRLLISLSEKESTNQHYDVLKITDEILKTCTHSHIARVARADALAKLKRWTEAKEFIEQSTASLSVSIHKSHAHESVRDSLTKPIVVKELRWYENHDSKIAINQINIVQAILCMGNELGEIYVRVLKNQDISRSRSTEAMNHLKNILHDLRDCMRGSDAIYHQNTKISNSMNGSIWSWVTTNIDRIERLITNKAAEDISFRSNEFNAARTSYGTAVEVTNS